ncbi:MAG: hypothetical protein Sapg2KO_51290 [Saprospiraceae bacterium]
MSTIYRLILLTITYLITPPFTNLVFGQEDSLGLKVQYSPDALQEDFAVLRSSLEDYHIGLYNYTSKDKMDDVFQQVAQSLDQEMTVLEFFQILSILNPAIGNVHTKITPPTKMWTTLKQAMPVFPFDVYWSQNQLYILRNLSKQADLPEGSIIKSINGQDAREVFMKMTQLMNRDGYNQSYPVHRSCVSFGHIYAAHFGLPAFFEIEVRTPDGLDLKKNVAARSEVQLKDQQKARYQSDRIIWSKTKEPALSLKFEGDLAILKIRTFQESLIKEKGQKYKAFLKKAFKEIARKDIKNLVLDIRGNTGGQPEPTEFLLTYLLNNPFQICKSIEAKVAAIEDETYFIENGSVSYFEERPWQKADTSFILQDPKQFKVHQPQKGQFKGQLFLLIDGFTSSAAGSFAGQIRSQERAIIVGEEAGGSPFLTVARIIPKLELPNSKIVLSLPLIQSTKNVSFENTGHGVVPNQTIRPSIKDMLSGHDPVLAWIREQL